MSYIPLSLFPANIKLHVFLLMVPYGKALAGDVSGQLKDWTSILSFKDWTTAS